ncbi:MAG TPA: outer membrane beta-barrel protein, partial [Chitinophagaceae bacterium]
NKTFRNWLPLASFKYNFSRYKSFSLNYTTSTNQPTMSQLQPVPDVTNPLYIREGNPDLKQEFRHTVRGNVTFVSPYKNKNFFMNFSATMSDNKIVNFDSLDFTNGKRKSKPVNVDGTYNLGGSISYSMPLRFMKASMEVSSRVNYNSDKQYFNNLENEIKTLTLGPSFRLDVSPTDKFSFTLGTDFSINNSKYSQQASQDNKYFSQEYSVSFDWQLPKNFFLSSDFTYTMNTRRAEGFNTNIPIWNASFSKQFLKYNRGEIKLSVADLLNKNVNISRNAGQSYVEDREVNTLRRFFLLSFTYSLTKSGLTKEAHGTFMVR